MDAAGADVDAVTDGVRLLPGTGVLGVRDGELAVEDQMRCQASVGMWPVVRIAVFWGISLRFASPAEKKTLPLSSFYFLWARQNEGMGRIEREAR